MFRFPRHFRHWRLGFANGLLHLIPYTTAGCFAADLTWPALGSWRYFEQQNGSWMRSKVLPSKIWFRCQSLLVVWLGNWLQEVVAAKSAAQTLKVRGHGNGNRSVEFLGYMSHRDKKHIGKDTPSSFTKHLSNIEQSWQHNFSSLFFNFPIQLHWRLQLLQWRWICSLTFCWEKEVLAKCGEPKTENFWDWLRKIWSPETQESMNRLNREINALLLNPSIKGAAWTLGPIHGRPAMMDLGWLGVLGSATPLPRAADARGCGLEWL